MRFRILPCAVALLAACAPSREQPPASTIVVVDDNGDTTRLAAAARRVVSLSPATTELVFALGAGTQLVGRTRWCDFPAEARLVADVGDGIPPNLESVLGQKPDLVLLYRSPQNTDAADRLRSAGIAVVTLRMDQLDDVARVSRLLGPALGRQATGDSLAAALDSALATIRAARARSTDVPPSVLLLAWDQPPIAIGAGSFQSEILTLAGGANVFADVATPSATVSIEAIAARDPRFIITSDTVPAWSRRAEWRVIPAVAQQRFIPFDDPAFGRPSPRAPLLIAALSRQIAAVAR